MPDELVAIVIVMSILTFVFSVIKSMQNYKLKRYEHESGGRSEASLTTSELREMITQAVDDANASIRGELADLSDRLAVVEDSTPRLLIDQDKPVQEKTVGRQARERQR